MDTAPDRIGPQALRRTRCHRCDAWLARDNLVPQRDKHGNPVCSPCSRSLPQDAGVLYDNIEEVPVPKHMYQRTQSSKTAQRLRYLYDLIAYEEPISTREIYNLVPKPRRLVKSHLQQLRQRRLIVGRRLGRGKNDHGGVQHEWQITGLKFTNDLK